LTINVSLAIRRALDRLAEHRQRGRALHEART
jgi:predicted transcriptional regulator